MLMKVAIIVVCLLPQVLSAQYERPGSSSAEFLNIGVHARAEAMAGAYLSIVDGAEAVYYNPAALARIKGVDISFGYTSWFASIRHEFLSIALPIGLHNTFAISATALHTDEMKVRTPFQPDGTGETFYAGSYRLGISYSRQLTDHVSAGITANYIRLYLHHDFSENGYAGDIAVLYDTGIRNFRFALHLSNFGSQIKFVNETYPMPTSFSFGLSANALETDSQAFLVSISANKPNDGSPRLNIGGEYNYQDYVFLRAGYNFDDIVKSFAFGGGLKLEVGSHGFSVDYSYSDFGFLGGTPRFNIGFRY